ncbi:leucine-rich repeat-containing protein (LRR) [Tieghemostelium lacteum]|uniref:Leucine-rich repeat-containing protein (LRR) n=1 Tax=Tieghemostelium lacteum TaxID=361077 RepID=A0A151Z3K5_TIELA|nr:leucine-rich repeat-containing protein (LRR) [Tieghemostelium lacteum]|eukprot:KYQ88529.1 leucine-rich repeat-containing protein (LRR) [Tieghemostelium lacteum]
MPIPVQLPHLIIIKILNYFLNDTFQKRLLHKFSKDDSCQSSYNRLILNSLRKLRLISSLWNQKIINHLIFPKLVINNYQSVVQDIDSENRTSLNNLKEILGKQSIDIIFNMDKQTFVSKNGKPQEWTNYNLVKFVKFLPLIRHLEMSIETITLKQISIVSHIPNLSKLSVQIDRNVNRFDSLHFIEKCDGLKYLNLYFKTINVELDLSALQSTQLNQLDHVRLEILNHFHFVTFRGIEKVTHFYHQIEYTESVESIQLLLNFLSKAVGLKELVLDFSHLNKMDLNGVFQVLCGSHLNLESIEINSFSTSNYCNLSSLVKLLSTTKSLKHVEINIQNIQQDCHGSALVLPNHNQIESVTSINRTGSDWLSMIDYSKLPIKKIKTNVPNNQVFNQILLHQKSCKSLVLTISTDSINVNVIPKLFTKLENLTIVDRNGTLNIKSFISSINSSVTIQSLSVEGPHVLSDYQSLFSNSHVSLVKLTIKINQLLPNCLKSIQSSIANNSNILSLCINTVTPNISNLDLLTYIINHNQTLKSLEICQNDEIPTRTQIDNLNCALISNQSLVSLTTANPNISKMSPILNTLKIKSIYFN